MRDSLETSLSSKLHSVPKSSVVEVPPSKDPQLQPVQPWGLPAVTLRVEATTFRAVADEVGRQAGVGLAFPAQVGDKPVSFIADKEPGETAIRRLAAMVGLAAVKDGQLVQFVERGKAVEGVTLVRTGYADPTKLGEALKSMGGDDVKVTVVGDRVVVAGSPAVLERAAQMREWFDKGYDGWHLEVKLVRVSKKFAERVGIDWKVSANVKAAAGTLIDDLIPAPLVGARAEALVEAVAQFSQTDEDATIVYSAPLLVMEGRSATLQQGDRLPILRKAVSDQGTVTQTGFDTIDTGFKLRALATRVGSGVLLELEPELSAVTGFVGEVPVLSRSSVQASCVVKSGEWIVLGGLESAEKRVGRTGLPGVGSPPLGGSTDSSLSESMLLFVVRATRVFAAQ